MSSACDHTDRCTGCGCSECGALAPAGELTPVTLPSGATGRACRACAADDGPSDGVPVAVEEELSGAQTVRRAYVPIGADGLGEVFARREREAERARKGAAA